jgi:hypothetical protein
MKRLNRIRTTAITALAVAAIAVSSTTFFASPASAAKEQFQRSKPHVNATATATPKPTHITYESENQCQIDDGFGGTITVSC